MFDICFDNLHTSTLYQYQITCLITKTSSSSLSFRSSFAVFVWPFKWKANIRSTQRQKPRHIKVLLASLQVQNLNPIAIHWTYGFFTIPIHRNIVNKKYASLIWKHRTFGLDEEVLDWKFWMLFHVDSCWQIVHDRPCPAGPRWPPCSPARDKAGKVSLKAVGCAEKNWIHISTQQSHMYVSVVSLKYYLKSIWNRYTNNVCGTIFGWMWGHFLGGSEIPGPQVTNFHVSVPKFLHSHKSSLRIWWTHL